MITAQSKAMSTAQTPAATEQAPMSVDAPAPTSAAPTPTAAPTAAPTTSAAPTKPTFTMPKTTQERQELLREKFGRADDADRLEMELAAERAAAKAALEELALFREQAANAKKEADARRLDEGLKRYAPALQSATSFDPENDEHKKILAEKVLDDEELNALLMPLMDYTTDLQSQLEETQAELELMRAHLGTGHSKKRPAADESKVSASKATAAAPTATAASTPAPAAAPRKTTTFMSRSEALKRANQAAPATEQAKPEEKKPQSKQPTQLQPTASFNFSGQRQFGDGGLLSGGKNSRQLEVTAQSAKLSRDDSLSGHMQAEFMDSLADATPFAKFLLNDMGKRLSKRTSEYNVSSLEIKDPKMAHYSLADAFTFAPNQETASLRPHALSVKKQDD